MIWAVFAAMFLLAAAIALLPLYRARATPEAPGGEALGVYRQQLGELERDLSLGLLNEEEAEAARLEIHRRMLAVGEESEAAATGDLPKTASTNFAIGVALSILAGATAFYVTRGAPSLVSFPPDRTVSAAPQFELPPAMGKIEDRLAQLAAKLAAEPENLKGWTMLARSYRAMGRTSDAANAYGRAAALDPENLELRLIQSDLLVEALDGLVSPAARLVLTGIEEIDPSHPAPRFYLGLAEYQNNKTRAALKIWQALADDSPADAPWLPPLTAQIERARAELGIEE